ncbi:MAG: pimeloyl-ACP methyl ester carboxylesterase [Hyphomicrobiaceae bacterium]|jgi:pimeloyl-ACP methyl ester carboxylesterase
MSDAINRITGGPTSHFFYSQRLRLHYVDYGGAGKPLLVLVHGGRDHCRNWDRVAPTLTDAYHVVAPDLRGHGDSAWAVGSQYSMSDYVLDLAQLLGHFEDPQVTLVGHSLGGNVVLHYAGLYPERVVKVAAIEGLGPPPEMIEEKPVEERMKEWIDTMRDLSQRTPRPYDDLDEAVTRMRGANPHLSEEMARHLTVHGTVRQENGAYTWKFDNYVRAWGPQRYDFDAVKRLWNRISCPVLLVRGAESWAHDPTKDGRADNFRNVNYVEFAGAGHWVHHDRLDEFMAALLSFLEMTETRGS